MPTPIQATSPSATGDKGSHASAGAHVHPTSNPDRPARRQPFHASATARRQSEVRRLQCGLLRTLDTAYRVTDLAVSLDFYGALDYQEVGRISLGGGATLTVLKFPARGSSRSSWCTGQPTGPCRSAPGSATSSSR